MDQNVKHMIKSPPIDKNNPCYPGNILHSFEARPRATN